MGLAGGAVTVNNRLSKKKALKDITNKLKTKPMSMKPNRSGLKSGNGIVIRKVGTSNKWVSQGERPNLNSRGPNGINGSIVRGELVPSVPRDPTCDRSFGKTPPITLIYSNDGFRAQKGLGEDRGMEINPRQRTWRMLRWRMEALGHPAPN